MATGHENGGWMNDDQRASVRAPVSPVPQPYTLLCEARELLGKAHDKVATATMNYGGEHNAALVGVCPTINDLIERLHDACGACNFHNR